MVDQLVSFGLTRVQRLFQRIEHEVGPHRAAYVPADDAPSEDVDHEGDIDETLPGRDIGEIADPQLVRPLGLELAVDPVKRTWRLRIGKVVRTTLPRMTPRRPALRIRRSTVQRATSVPSRRSWRQTLSAP
jgi:hypothetical protein